MSFSSWLKSAVAADAGLGGSVEGSAGAMVRKATDGSLRGADSVDWAVCLEIADYASASRTHADLVVAALKNRTDELLRKLKATDGRSAKLLVALVGVLAKNGAVNAAEKAIESVGEIGMLSAKRPGQAFPEVWLQAEVSALQLIQELHCMFREMQASRPGFSRTFSRLKRMGVIFPEVDESTIAVATAPAMSPEAPAFGAMTRKLSTEGGLRPADFEKLEHDISVLEAKLDVASFLLQDQANISRDSEEVLDVLDFLEQCKPRVVELIEASALGVISDGFLDACLKVNDRLCSIVDQLHNLPLEVDHENTRENAVHVEAEECVVLDDETAEPLSAPVIPKLKGPPPLRRKSSSSCVQSLPLQQERAERTKERQKKAVNLNPFEVDWREFETTGREEEDGAESESGALMEEFRPKEEDENSNLLYQRF